MTEMILQRALFPNFCWSVKTISLITAVTRLRVWKIDVVRYLCLVVSCLCKIIFKFLYSCHDCTWIHVTNKNLNELDWLMESCSRTTQFMVQEDVHEDMKVFMTVRLIVFHCSVNLSVHNNITLPYLIRYMSLIRFCYCGAPSSFLCWIKTCLCT